MEDTTMNNTMDFYKMVRENRFAMYSKPRRYYNRDGIKGSAIKFLFFVQAIIFFLMLVTLHTATAQTATTQPVLMADANINGTIANYTTIYNSGKVFQKVLVLLLNFSIHGWIKHPQTDMHFIE